MTKEEISKIKVHIELHARRERGAIKITELLRKAVAELESIPELKEQISRLEKEIAELKGDTDLLALIKKLKEDVVEYKADHDKQLTKAKEIILKLYNAGRDVLMCGEQEEAYTRLDEAINDKSIEQFLKEVEK